MVHRAPVWIYYLREKRPSSNNGDVEWASLTLIKENDFAVVH